MVQIVIAVYLKEVLCCTDCVNMSDNQFDWFTKEDFIVYSDYTKRTGYLTLRRRFFEVRKKAACPVSK
jgi:hypothetical protein